MIFNLHATLVAWESEQLHITFNSFYLLQKFVFENLNKDKKYLIDLGST